MTCNHMAGGARLPIADNLNSKLVCSLLQQGASFVQCSGLLGCVWGTESVMGTIHTKLQLTTILGFDSQLSSSRVMNLW